MSRVLVAVDGSPESADALRWATAHADTNNMRLRVVTAYPYPHTGAEIPMPHIDLNEAAAEGARERALLVVEDVLGHRSVDHVVSPGSIDAVLIEYADEGSVIVVGTRIRHRFWHRFRSSLTNRITGRVECTVISVASNTRHALRNRSDHARSQ